MVFAGVGGVGPPTRTGLGIGFTFSTSFTLGSTRNSPLQAFLDALLRMLWYEFGCLGGVANRNFRKAKPWQSDAPVTPRTGENPAAYLRQGCASILRKARELGPCRAQRYSAVALPMAQASGQPLRLARGACCEPIV